MHRPLTPRRALAVLAAIAAVALPATSAAAAPIAAAPPAAAPPAAPPAAAATSPSARTTALPRVWPAPQRMTSRGARSAIPERVALVVGPRTDASARTVVTRVLQAAGARTVLDVDAGAPVPRTGLTVTLGGPAENPATAPALAALGVQGPTGLAAGGYVLAADAGRVVLAGVDPDGTYAAAQTLRQLVIGRTLPGVVVRDWPATPLRGVVEGFYGAPWSQQDRLSQLDFLGRTKQNAYVYTPKDDPYLRAQWRDEYPPAQLARITELVRRAQQDHVRFTYAISPGLSVCYSSAADRAALVRKLESIYAIGVRSFAVPLDDIDLSHWNCAADGASYGSGPAAAGHAQADLVDSVVTGFVRTHPDVAPLETVPTEYSDVTGSPYKTALREDLDPSVVVEWTGVGVVAPSITTTQAREAKQVFGHPVLLWDNYPVNDYQTSRLFLGPYVHRATGLPAVLAGITANPMVQEEASKVALFTSGAFAWNPGAYDAPAAYAASLDDLAGTDHGPVRAALQALADNSHSSPIDATESPTIAPLVAALDRALDTGHGLDPAASRLDAAFAELAAAPGVLRGGLANPAFLHETRPWLDKLGAYGRAGRTAVALVRADAAGRTGEVTRLSAQLELQRAALDRLPQQLGVGVLDPFLASVAQRTAPDPGADASLSPAAVSLAPGASASVTLTLTDTRSAAATSHAWTTTGGDGVTVTPASGTLTVPAGGSATVTLTVSAAAGSTPGVRSVLVDGQGVVDRALPVRVGAGAGSDRAVTADFSGATASLVDLGAEPGTTARTVGVGANPGDVVLSADGRTAYVAGQGDGTVSVVDVASGTRRATVTVGSIPAGMALTPDGRTLWVANYGDDTVQPVDTTTLAAGTPVPVGDGPEDPAIGPDGATLWVPNIHDDTVTPVDLGTRTALAPVAVGPSPFAVVVAPDGRTAYVSDSGGSAVTRIDTATRTTRSNLVVSGQAYGLALSPDGRSLWVTASTGDTLTRVDTVTGVADAPVTVGHAAFDVALDWDGTTAYVTTADAGRLVPVDTATGALGAPYPTGSYPLAVAVTGVPVG